MDKIPVKEEEKKDGDREEEKKDQPKGKKKRKVVDVNSAYYGFKSSCVDPSAECYLGLVHVFCTTLNKMYLGALMLKTLCELMRDDVKCREYISKMPHPTLRFPTFMHSFKVMADEMKEDQELRLQRDQNQLEERKAIGGNYVEKKKKVYLGVIQICD